MSNVNPGYKPEVFRNDSPIIIATNRSSAVLLPVRLRYSAQGYPAGQVLARNTTDGLYDKYSNAGASGTDAAIAILFDAKDTADFSTADASGSSLAVGIFGGCTVFYDKLTGIDANGVTDLGGKVITDATGVKTLKF